MKEETKETKETKESAALTEAQINVLYTRGLINRATWNNALRSFRGVNVNGHAGPTAIMTCEVAIEALVERAVDAACAVIQDKLGVTTGDLAAATLSDGAIERELTRYVHAELAERAMADALADEAPASEEPVSEEPVSEEPMSGETP